MTPEEQRRAIATACGWTEIKQVPFTDYLKLHCYRWFGIRPICFSEAELPDYLNDLNAMHEAEKALNEKEQVWYLQKLTQVRFRDGVGGTVACMIDKAVFATAGQRAEAFLRTLNLWK